MAKTFKDRLIAKQEAKFIGRSEHLTVFKNNLKADEPYAIINIYGQGGVGKTYLSRQYKTIADENNCLSAYSDEDTKSILQWMEIVAQQFKNHNADLSDFYKSYKTYQQETQKLEADPEKPKGIFGGIMKTLTKGAIKEVRKLPGAEIIGGFIDEDGIASAVGELTDFVRKKIGNKDEVELVLEPLKVLTPLFWKGITNHAADKKFVCFFIDTFEDTDTVLETWLLDILNNKYGDIPPNILLIIAGRDPLSTNRWSAFTEFTQQIPLEPFTEPEAEAYFNAQGIWDAAIKSDICHLSGRLPVLMAWLTEASKTGKGNVQDACETAVERFLKWVVDENHRNLALKAALPRKLNQDIIESFLTDKAQCKAYFDWLCKQPFVMRKGDYWSYHSVVRDQMLRYVRTRSPKEWSNQHQMMSDYYESLQKNLELTDGAAFMHKTWAAFEQERLYHALCAKPDRNIPVAMEHFVKQYMISGLFSAAILGDTLIEAGNDAGQDIIKGWGLRITTTIETSKLENHTSLQELIEDILQQDFIKSVEQLVFLNYYNGLIYNLKQDFDNAIESFQKAIAFKSDYYKEVFNHLGSLYQIKGDFDKAIESHQKAIDIKPDYYEAFFNIGNAYQNIRDFDKAIEYYHKAIDIKPDYYEAFNNMGSSYQNKGEFDKAIEFFQKAIVIKPHLPEPFSNMGNSYRCKGNFNKAIEFYQKALELKPDFYEPYYNMGILYGNKYDYDKAIEFYQKAVDINPHRYEAFNDLGFLYLKTNDLSNAEHYLLKSIDFGCYDFANMNLGHVYLCKKEETKAIQYYQNSLNEFNDPTTFWGAMKDDYVYLAQYGLTEEYYQIILEKIKRISAGM